MWMLVTFYRKDVLEEVLVWFKRGWDLPAAVALAELHGVRSVSVSEYRLDMEGAA